VVVTNLCKAAVCGVPDRRVSGVTTRGLSCKPAVVRKGSLGSFSGCHGLIAGVAKPWVRQYRMFHRATGA
jgi:hypothetical protein